MAMLGKRRPPRGASRLASSPRSEAPTTTDDAEIEILRLSHDGRGVARATDGKTLFVERSLPGERVEVAVHRARQRYDEAHVRTLVSSSPERVAPSCGHFGHCGGCDLQHMALPAQHRHKQAVLGEQLSRQGLELAAPPELVADAGYGYRRRARLGVKVDSRGEVHLGFRARGSHHLIDTRECPILVPALAALLEPLRQCLAGLEAPRRVGHVELVQGEAGVALVVRQLRESLPDASHWRAFALEHGIALAWLLGRDDPRLEWLTEPVALSYTLACGEQRLTLGFAPGDFLQVNAAVNQRLVDAALAWLAPRGDERVLDLFAGVGNFSLALATRVRGVTGVEGNPAMVARLASNARDNGLDGVDARQADLTQEGALDELLALQDWDLVVLDPPREGAETPCRRLARSRVPRLLYVSCDPATLARDAALLVQGGYRLARTAVADMFPQTAHLEAMLLFERDTARPAPKEGVAFDG